MPIIKWGNVRDTVRDVSSPETSVKGHYIVHAFPLPHSILPVFPGRELVHVSCVLAFLNATQGMSLGHLTLVDSSGQGALFHGSHGTKTTKQTICGWPPPQGTVRIAHPQSFCEKVLFACPEALG